MNISEGFIKRPIATSLLMAAIALFGMVAYRALPVSDLPNVDFPTLLVTAQLPGANPETMGASVATPLENQFSTISGLEQMTSVNSLGSTQITLEFALEPEPRRRGGRRAGRHHAGVAPAAAGHADAAGLHEGQPGRSADPLSGRHVDDAAAVDARRVRRDAHRAADLAGLRRRAGADARRPEVRDARAARSARARRAADRHQRGRSGAAQLERQRPDRLDHRSASGVHAAGERAADERRRVPQPDHLVPQQLAGAARTARHDRRRRRGSADRRRGSTRARRKQRAITLGIQRQPGTNTIAVADAVKSAAAAVPRRAAGQRPHGPALRPLGHDPRVVPRRAVHDGADARRSSSS